MSIPERLQKLRGRKTLSEFARENRTSPQNIHNYERVRNPSADFLASLAQKGININWVLTGEGPIYLEIKNAKSIALLTSELEKLPQELREVLIEALRTAVQEAGDPPPTYHKLRLASWCQKVLRKAQDEIDRLFDI